MQETVTTPAAMLSKRGRMIWGLSLHGWEDVMRGSLAIVGICGLLVGLATFFVVTLQREEITAAKIEFDKYKTEASEQVAEAQARTASSMAMAADATLKASRAALDAAKAQLELEKFKSARSLTSEQQTRITDALMSFSGTEFDAAIGPKGDPEPIVFLRFLEPSLVQAGWKPIPWTGGGELYTESGMPPIGLTAVTNIIVDVHPSHWEKLGPAANALAKALLAEGIDAVASNTANVNSDAVHIRIGRKM